MSGVVIVDTGGANLASLRYALARLGRRAQVSADACSVRAAGHVILPGVGAAAPAMQRLAELNLISTIKELRQPVLGICLGMQLLFEASDEARTRCLGLIPGRVDRLAADAALPVPHMGWNRVRGTADPELLSDVPDGSHFYFVHSYAAAPGPDTCAECDYGSRLAAIVRRGNFHGTQFHPERSGVHGATVLRNFLALR